eukprot:GFYU01001382.1.p1 GENE.GFYU01001382.1~~GFYU01001382.1.p1  ORF type:complete len:316 (-),score=112.07 GFYU01001382.1:136-1083(-)
MSDTFTLNNGNTIPSIGYGTWPGGTDVSLMETGIEHALLNGYKHLDTAEFYKVEDVIGNVLQRVLKAPNGPKREDIYITSKVWNSHHQPEHVKAACKQTLKNLQTDYLDLYLVHWPLAFAYTGPEPGIKWKEDKTQGVELEKCTLEATWKAMEELVDEGLVKNIGVSNYTTALLHEMMSYARIKPVCNQVELHPYMVQEGLLMNMKKYNILPVAYSPLGGPASKGTGILENPVVTAIAATHNKSAGQVVLRWHLQRGVCAIPKSSTPSRIDQNMNIFDFELSAEEMAKISGLNANIRVCDLPHPVTGAWKCGLWE